MSLFFIFIGTFLRQYSFSDETIMLISYPGELFLRILKLLTLPLLISSLVNVSASLNARMNGKIALRTISYFILTTMASALMGICIAAIVEPGTVDFPVVTNDIQNKQPSKLVDSILDLGR